MFCNKCGNQINPGDNICTKCGNPVEGAGTAQNFQTQQPQANYAQQQNYQQPQRNFAPQPKKIDFQAIKNNSVWQLNIGWLMAIVALFGIFSTFCMGMAGIKDYLTFSFVQIGSIFDDDIPGGFIAFSIFIWIFSIVSIIDVIITVYFLFANKVSDAFKFSLVNFVLISITKILQMISVSTLGNEYSKPDLSYSLFLSLIIVIAAGIFTFFYAKKHNMDIMIKFNNGMGANPYQYQNVPNQFQNVNQGNPNQNPNQYQNTNQNTNQNNY